jgi:ubiquinone/menaquinone biosynthesis C-methylase UbiE
MTSPETAEGLRAGRASAAHEALIREQFSAQAGGFARSAELHDDAVLNVIVDSAAPKATDESLDVACGPGTVVAAFAGRVRRAVGLDATAAMLEQARALTAKRNLANVEWQQGDVYSLPFADDAFDIVSCRFAFHHFEHPEKAFAQMVRVCRPAGRVVVCDAVASPDAAKAAAFNAMERHRDPSTVAFRPLSFFVALFANAGLATPAVARFQVAYEPEQLVKRSFPTNDDRDTLRRLIHHLIATDAMDVDGPRDGSKFVYPSVVLTGIKP